MTEQEQKELLKIFLNHIGIYKNVLEVDKAPLSNKEKELVLKFIKGEIKIW